MSLTDVRRIADCPTCGRPRHIIPTCVCSHPLTAHNLGTGKKATVRTTCNAAAGSCPCTTYQEADGDV